MRNTYRVRTPENVVFEFELAGIASRAAAWFIDLVVMAALLMTAVQLLAPFMSATGGIAAAIYSVIAFVIQWWYAALCEWRMSGQTFGKRLLRLRALDARGLRITFVQAVVRNLVRIVDLLPLMYFVGGVSAFVDPHGRRLGDLAAGTIVVRERRPLKPSAVVPASERHNSFANDPAVKHAARRITAPERDAMIALGLRRDELPLAVRKELFEKMSGHLQRRLGVERPSFLTDEKFVLGLTAAVFGSISEPVRRRV